MERASVNPPRKGLWGRIKGWFSRKPDTRTLSERMQEIESEKILTEARRKLVVDPASLTKQETALFNEEEMAQYVRFKVARQREKMK